MGLHSIGTKYALHDFGELVLTAENHWHTELTRRSLDV